MNYSTQFEIKKAYNYFNHSFGSFTFKFAKPVEFIELTRVTSFELVELSVQELFALQRDIRRAGGLNEWIILKIYFADGAQSFMSFDH